MMTHLHLNIQQSRCSAAQHNALLAQGASSARTRAPAQILSYVALYYTMIMWYIDTAQGLIMLYIYILRRAMIMFHIDILRRAS